MLTASGVARLAPEDAVVLRRGASLQIAGGQAPPSADGALGASMVVGVEPSLPASRLAIASASLP